MTAQLSIFPVSASMGTATSGVASATNNGTNGATNPFTQLLQGMVASLDEQGQQQALPFFPGISITTELTEQGNPLPPDGQGFAQGLLLGQYLNPFMALNQVDVAQFASGDLQLEADVLSSQGRPAIPAQLASVLQQLADNKPGVSLRSEQLPLNLGDLTSAAITQADTGNGQKIDQLMASITARLAGAVEKTSADKIEGSISSSQLSTQLLNNSVSGTSAHTVSASRSEMTAPAMPVPPLHPGWSQAVGERVQWMVNQQIQKAEIRLDPPDLGSLEVRVVVQKEHAHVSFAAPNAQVRDALEAAIPRLREMLGEQGLDLANVDVGQHSFAEQREQNSAEEFASAANSNSNLAETESSGIEEEKTTIIQAGNGLLDTYV